MTSGDPTTVARCGYCGKEFDVRGFQVVVVGRGAYHSTECARLDADGPPRPNWHARGPGNGRGLKRR
jgi:hypothetical protein